MLKKVFQYILMEEPLKNLTSEQRHQIMKQIDSLNYKRLKVYLAASIFVEALLILLYDVPHLYLAAENELWEYKSYFILHFFLFLTGIGGILLINCRLKIMKEKKVYDRIDSILLILLVITEFIFLSGIDILDQYTKGSSIVLLVDFFLCSAALIIRFPYNLPVYTIPFCMYASGLILLQNDRGLMISNLINGGILYIGVICVSSFVYNNIFSNLSKNIILQEVNDKLIYLSSHDSLTGLYNRGSFEEKAKERLDLLEEKINKTAIILIDIDHFKQVNDTFGHPIGDKVLKEISSILIKDITDKGLATRWGGEEFLLLLPGYDYTEALLLAETIRENIENHIITIDSMEIRITASFGVAEFNGSFEKSFKISYKQADRALYQAKQQGRNRVAAAN